MQLHLGLARLWAQQGDPNEAWRAAIAAEPDTPYAVLAGNVLHPNLPRGLPAFIPSFAAPPTITRLEPARQLEALRRRAQGGGLRERLLYGVGLQRVGRPVSAAQVFEQAARFAPDDVEAQVAGAVGQFDKDEPARAFGRLARSRGASRTSRRCASTSACSCSGRAASTRRSASYGSRHARKPALRSPARPPATSRRSARQGRRVLHMSLSDSAVAADDPGVRHGPRQRVSTRARSAFGRGGPGRRRPHVSVRRRIADPRLPVA